MSTVVSDLLRKNYSFRLTPRAPTDERAFWPDRAVSNPPMPTADMPLLVYLLSVLLFIAIAGWIVHALAQPTVLINASFERERRVTMVLSSPSLANAEQSAVDLASRENERQGLQPIAVAEAGGQHEPPLVKAAKVAAVKPPKTRRAAKAQSRYATPYWRDAWAFAPSGNGFRSNGGFGSWWR